MCITFTITFVIYKYIHVYMCVESADEEHTKKSITTLVSNVVTCA